MAVGTTNLNGAIYSKIQDAPKETKVKSISEAVLARHAEYTQLRRLKIKIGTWNIASTPGAEDELAVWFGPNVGLPTEHQWPSDGDFSNNNNRISPETRSIDTEDRVKTYDYTKGEHGEEIGLYVLGLQESVGLSNAREYIGRVYNESGCMARWRKALENIIPEGYIQIMGHQLSGLLLFIYASPFIAPKISSVNTVSIATGMMGYLGNKGAILTRMVIGETTQIVFINSHLTSGAEPVHLEKRCNDVAQILQKTNFQSARPGEISENAPIQIGDEDFAFWFGDLNFRIDDLPGDEIRRLLMLHATGKYNSEQFCDEDMIQNFDEDEEATFVIEDEEEEHIYEVDAHALAKKDNLLLHHHILPKKTARDLGHDPTSLQATLDSLLPHDQLRYVQRNRKAFHDGWCEGRISFLPTYKYNLGEELIFDTSEKKRAPSWCDRILYRTRKDKIKYEEKLRKEFAEENYNDLEGDQEDDTDMKVLFNYNPEEDGEDNPWSTEVNEDENAQTIMQNQNEDKEEVILDTYTSHQKVISSDHKPLNATFTLYYDEAIPDLKAKAHQDVVRDFDRAENEGRPGVTVVIDGSMKDNFSNYSSGNSGIIDFGKVAFQEKKNRHLTIANTSQVGTTISFVERTITVESESRHIPSWLSVSFINPGSQDDGKVSKIEQDSITLEPGEAVSALLELSIEEIELVKKLNETGRQLDEVLVLYVTGGRDHFIPLRGEWLQSCFGRSIDQLVRIPKGGVRAVLEEKSDFPQTTRNHETCCSIPRELLELIETVHFLTERVVAESSILEKFPLRQDAPGWPFEPRNWIISDTSTRESYKRLIFEALDKNQKLSEILPGETFAYEKLEIISEVLLLFLCNIPDRIIPNKILSALETSLIQSNCSLEDIKAQVLDELSGIPNHSVSFVFLTSMLTQVVSELASIGTSTANLSNNSNVNVVSSMRAMLKIRRPTEPLDHASLKRDLIEKAIVEVFLPAIFQDNGNLRERDRKTLYEKKRIILKAFLKPPNAGNG
ncbi:low similarity to INP54/type II inositol-1,4,5-trisphosphate 5-phosphatase [Blumeria hordei DH14]|uniref:Low similarity to INP54/type II inositol-1,4,5-trisphosphate 5-phosphatase n=1 Tax=Blumeria graminis f. sp. hordei (strain DH14) TaxID=546991 RepID=N1JFZ8_BLUG1|nr:low similarity to INP54/type II inositol-1,4,5-trisphosphate 5-phosphatase [Blumeria hordei DH14]